MYLFQITNQAGNTCYIMSLAIIDAQEEARRFFNYIEKSSEIKEIVILGKISNYSDSIFYYPEGEKKS